jgi:hypothetical protein
MHADILPMVKLQEVPLIVLDYSVKAEELDLNLDILFIIMKQEFFLLDINL